jgi:DNA sulfur modification protein DndB
MPVIIFNDLNATKEVTLFIDINTTQKGVPTTLLLDIKNLSGRETKKEDLQRQLFDKLNTDSVLAGLLSPAKSKVGKITRVSFNQATNELFENGFFHNKDIETIFRGVKNFLQAAEIVFKNSKSEKAKLTNSILFRAIFAIFNEVVDKCLRNYSDFKVESIVNILDPISKINFDGYTGTSNATYSKVVSDMRKELNEYNKRYFNLNSENIF